MENKSEADELRALVATARQSGRRLYPREVRVRLLSFIRRRLIARKSLKAIAAELDMKPHTVSYLKSCLTEGAPRQPAVMRRVEIVAPAAPTPPSGVVLMGGCGVRVEGLSTEGIADVLRRLS